MDVFDDICIGNINLNDSNDFFAMHHENHEINRPVEQKSVSNRVTNNENNQNQLNRKNLVPVRKVELKSLIWPEVSTINHSQKETVIEASETVRNLTEETIPNESLTDNGQGAVGDKTPESTLVSSNTKGYSRKNNQIKKEAGPSSGRTTKINLPTTSSTSTDNASLCRRQYEYAEEYQKRKEYRMKKLEAEEREQRKCIAKPMPNFKAIHSKTRLKELTETHVMSPETPQVLRRGIAMKDRLKKKLEEHERKQAERPLIVARAADVLLSEPFKPKLESQTTHIEPFDLKMNDRLIERKQWEESRERERVLKIEKEEKEKQEAEEKLRKLIRQKTTFKAKPNPFK